MMIYRIFYLLIFCLVGSSLLQAERYVFTKPKLGTVVSILIDVEKGDYKPVASAVFDRIDKLNLVFSDYHKNSELMQLCSKAYGDQIKVSEELFEVLSQSKVLYYFSAGAFDPTVGAWTKQWRAYRDGVGEKPNKETPGYDLVRLDESLKTVEFLEKGIELDLGGIAKGYIVDEVSEILKANGIDRFLVGIGGELIAGAAPVYEARGWKIGVEDPEKKTNGYLYLKQQALSTSGASYQFVNDSDGVMGHIVHPESRSGIDNSYNVSVVAGSSMMADGLATTLRLVGREAAEGLFDVREFSCLFVGKDFQEITKIGNFPSVIIKN